MSASGTATAARSRVSDVLPDSDAAPVIRLKRGGNESRSSGSAGSGTGEAGVGGSGSGTEASVPLSCQDDRGHSVRGPGTVDSVALGGHGGGYTHAANKGGSVSSASGGARLGAQASHRHEDHPAATSRLGSKAHEISDGDLYAYHHPSPQAPGCTPTATDVQDGGEYAGHSDHAGHAGHAGHPGLSYHNHDGHLHGSIEPSHEPGHEIDESVSGGAASKLRSKPKLPACMQNALNLKWVIPNYSKLREEAAKKKCHTTETQTDENGHSWRLKLYPNGTKSDGNLSLFLDIPELPFGWERTVCFALTLISHKDDTKSVTKNVHRHVFKSQKNDLCNWGWSAFVGANRVLREGFLLNDELHVTAAITVENTSTKMDPSEVDVYLSYASESGCADSVMTCLAQGACVNSESEDKFTPLHYACNTTKEYLPVVQLLVSRGADVNKLNKYGETALLKAAYRGHAGVVRTLLDSGADTGPTSTAGLSALSAAVGQVSDCRSSPLLFL